MNCNCVKLERVVIFIKYIASVVTLMFPLKILIWHKMMLPALNSLEVLAW